MGRRITEGFCCGLLRVKYRKQYNIVLNVLLAILPYITPSHSLVQASVLMWHSGEPLQPADSLQGEGETTAVVPVAQQEQSGCWGLAGVEVGGRERHRVGVHQIHTGCLHVPTLVNTGPRNCLDFRYNKLLVWKWFLGKNGSPF